MDSRSDKKEISAARSDQYSCPKCGEQVSRAEKNEHEDWHFAKDLQGHEDVLNSTPSQPSTNNSALTSPPSSQAKSQYAPPPQPPPRQGASRVATTYQHTNQVTEAANLRSRDEQQMQNRLQSLQYQYQIYNSEIEPEHETDYYCNCHIHAYKFAKYARLHVQDTWSKAVQYPGERAYNENPNNVGFSNRNPYSYRVMSPYGFSNSGWLGRQQRPLPNYHAQSIHQTIDLNNRLNAEAQAKTDAQEPRSSIWDNDTVEKAMSQLTIGDVKSNRRSVYRSRSQKGSFDASRRSIAAAVDDAGSGGKQSRFASFRKSVGMKTTEEKAVAKVEKMMKEYESLRRQILTEERGRWPDAEWRLIVQTYQEKVGMKHQIAQLRARCPIQYLHLLRAGYFEPIPVAWADQTSNPLKFSIESASGWRGITPSWRGYEDTAEERLYWVLNHRGTGSYVRLKPDFISTMEMARARMARAVEPPPQYFSTDDTCHAQRTSVGYSKQVMPPPFVAFDRPELATDDTMILLDVSGSMDFEPVRPIYDQYLVTGWTPSTQPKNKDVAKAIVRRFTDAMANHDHQSGGYDLVTFSNQADYIGMVNHKNFSDTWRRVRLGGGTRVMTGWQVVKHLHFQKHSASATHHPVYGWQAGPETPMLRLLLLLDGEATDMDEFELDLLGLSWAHVTIFLIGVDGCPHHHRHANELQRISDVNHHVSFVDAQGNTPERFVTHELLKRHLGFEISMSEFQQMEELPAYSEV